MDAPQVATYDGGSYLRCQAGSWLGEKKAALLLGEGKDVGLQGWGEKRETSHQMDSSVSTQSCSMGKVQEALNGKLEPARVQNT